MSVEESLRNLDAIALYENWLRVLGETISLGCSNPSSGGSAAVHPLADLAVGIGRPATYQCCGDESSFGCQPGKTPMNATGSLPDVVPYEVKPYGGWPGDFIWQAAEEIIPWAMLQASGDVPALVRLYPQMQAHIAFVTAATATTAGGLLDFGYYGDWNAAQGASTPYVENFYYTLSLQRAATVAAAVGNAADAIAFAAHALLITEAMVSQFFNGKVWDNGGANAQAMALSIGLGGNLTTNATATIAAALLQQASAGGYHPTCGLASCRHILQGLTVANASAAFEMATLTTPPSWGYMVSPDMPGTIWEAWGGDAHTSDGSKNHPMFCGGIGTWLYDDALGLRVSYAPRLPTPACEGGELPPRTTGDARCASALSSAVVREAGLSAWHGHVLCAVLADARSSCARPGHRGGCAYSDLHAATNHFLTNKTCHSAAAALDPATVALVVTAAPHADIAAELISASGWRKAGAGAAHLEWKAPALPVGACASNSSGGGEVFSLRATMPAGAAVSFFGIGVPLSRAAAAAVACCGKGTGASGMLRISARFQSHAADDQAIAVYHVDVRGSSMTLVRSAEKPGGGVVLPPFSSADIVTREAISGFAGTGVLYADEIASSPQDILFLQSTSPGSYAVAVEVLSPAE